MQDTCFFFKSNITWKIFVVVKLWVLDFGNDSLQQYLGTDVCSIFDIKLYIEWRCSSPYSSWIESVDLIKENSEMKDLS